MQNMLPSGYPPGADQPVQPAFNGPYVNPNATPGPVLDPAADIKPTKYKLRYAFTQQLLQAWRPRPTLKCAITIYTIIGLIFFAFGIAIIVLTNQITEVSARYDNLGPISKTSQVSAQFKVENDMTAPVYLFYQIKGFYQNHRRYILSQSLDQLRGNDKSAADLSDCDPVIYNANLSEWQINNIKVRDLNAVAIPCGAAARAFFNDTFSLASTAGKIYEFSDKDISWPDDREYKFKNIDLSRQWIDMTNERFINWMKIAPFSNFRKTWGVLNVTLPKGDYIMTINNTWNSSLFDGEKWFVLSETNAFGGRNEFLAYTYIAVGSLSIILAMIFSLRKFKRPKGITEYQLARAAQNT